MCAIQFVHAGPAHFGSVHMTVLKKGVGHGCLHAILQLQPRLLSRATHLDLSSNATTSKLFAVLQSEAAAIIKSHTISAPRPYILAAKHTMSHSRSCKVIHTKQEGTTLTDLRTLSNTRGSRHTIYRLTGLYHVLYMLASKVPQTILTMLPCIYR